MLSPVAIWICFTNPPAGASPRPTITITNRTLNYNLKFQFFANAKDGAFTPSFDYFILFSRVAELREVRCTRFRPYSAVTTKLFGRSSQGMTSPSFSARAKNSRVRLEVEVLSMSKMPMMLLSRTAISLPIDKYIPFSFCRGGAVPLPKSIG